MRVWERGVGVTLACGTGACATAVAAVRRGLTGRKVELVLDGGSPDRMARGRRPCADDRPAAMPFRGRLDLDKLARWPNDHEVVTFGCRLNAYESEAIKARAGEAQLQDTVVVNTCAVTAEAVRQSRQAIRLKRERPDAAHHRHRLRRADRAPDLCRHAGSGPGAGQCRKAGRGKLRRFRRSA